MEKGIENKNLSFLDFKRYENEIFFDTYDEIIKSHATVAKKTIIQIGENEIHLILKYYQKILLNTLFFNDDKILLEYNRWLYRVYFYKGIDLDFFSFLINVFKNVSNRYISSKGSITMNEVFEYVLTKHEEIKRVAPKRKFLLENEDESITLAKVLISGDSKKALDIAKSRSSTIDEFISFYNDIVSNAMKYIGYMWESGEISVAKEHIASNVLNDILIKLIDELPDQDDKYIHMFLSSAPNEYHGLGIKIASRVFQKLGFKVTNVGTNISSKEIKKAIMEFRPDVVVFSATLQTSLLDISLLIEDIVNDRAIFANPFKIGIAGNAFENMIHPAKTLKADFYINNIDDIFFYI